MKQREFLKLTALSLAVGLVSLACGGGEETTTATAPASSSGVVTTAPVPTASPTATAVSVPDSPNTKFASIDEMVTQSPKFPPFELDNIRYGGTFRNATSNTIGAWDPKFAASVMDDMRPTYEKLVELLPNDNDGFSHLGPGLAESWKFSADFKTITFSIRKGVKWHNLPPVSGRDFTADDAAFSLRRYMEADSSASGNYAQVESIEAPDRYTVIVKLKDPNVWALEDLFRTHQYVVARELVERPSGITTDVIGTGPYIMKNYGNRRGGLFVRNPDYWGKDTKGNRLPYTDEWSVTYVTDQATMVAGMRTNQFDYARYLTDLNALFPLVKSKPELRVFGTPVGGGTAITFNTTHAPWNDLRVRRAVSMVFDRQKLAEQVLTTSRNNWGWGSAVPWRTISDDPFKYDDYGPYYKYDPEAAKKLLIEAGFPDGKIIVQAPFALRPGDDKWLLASQQLLKQNGITFTIQPYDTPSFSVYNATRKIEDLGPQYTTTANYSLYWSASNLFLEESQVNTAFVRDPDIRKVVFQIRQTTDPARLRSYARALWDFDTQGVWRMWMAGEPSSFVTASRTRNITVRTGGPFGALLWMPWLADASRTQP